MASISQAVGELIAQCVEFRIVGERVQGRGPEPGETLAHILVLERHDEALVLRPRPCTDCCDPYIKGPDDAPLKDSAHRLFVVTEAE
jgi:hypothetical protein